ncbi:glycoside hydrolase family 17 protein [Poronia punctata]|nr:glycoside hydrolase family 17 protein [Poronia punctata]
MRLLAVCFMLLAAVQPSLGQLRHHHGAYRHRAHRDLTSNTDRVTISDASFSLKTELPEVVVYVDQYGSPIRTATETVVYIPITTSHPTPPTTVLTPPAPAPPPPAAEAAEPTSELSSAAQPTTAAPSTPEATSTSTSSPLASSQPDVVPDQGGLHGVTYSPYKGDGNCKTADEVDKDFSLFAKDYGVIRIYGVDCDQVSTVSKAAKKYGNKLLIGIFDIASVESAVATIAAGVEQDWSVVNSVSVGNELVNNGRATVGQSLSALAEARSALRAAGYPGPVVIVDTFVAVLEHPELCDQSDYCAINIHPFFDPNTGPANAGSFLRTTISSIRSKLSDPNQRIVVTETGWPWRGEANGVAIPGLDHQSTAISSIKSVFTGNGADLFLFTAFNDLWKKADPGTFMAEQFWGMRGLYSPSDQQN